MKNTNSTKILREFNPIIPCAWLPHDQVRLNEYMEMITHFVQSYMKEKLDAKYLCSEKSSD